MHFAFPFTIGEDGSAVVLAQGDPEEVVQGVKVLVLSQQGARLEVPGFGIPDPTFQTSIDTKALAEEAVRWDDRASVFTEYQISDMVANVRINVKER